MSSSSSSCSPSASAVHITALSPTFNGSASVNRPRGYIQPYSGGGEGSSSSSSSAAAPALIRASPTLNFRKRGSPYCSPSALKKKDGDDDCKSQISPLPPPAPPPPFQQRRPASSSSTGSRKPTLSASPQTSPLPQQQTDNMAISSPKRQRKPELGMKTLPKLYQSTHTADLVVLISDMLGELVGLNDCIPLSGAGLTRFHSRAPPTISIADYLNRLSVHASLQPSILLSMVYYIDILSTHYPPFVVSSLTVHRFLITAATVASKGLCDTFLTNSLYARVGGLSLMELNMLELEFLVRVGWRIVPKAEVLEEYYRSLVQRMRGRYRVEDDDMGLTAPEGSGGGGRGGKAKVGGDAG